MLGNTKKAILVTGVAGSGKSAVCKHLVTDGHEAYDIEEMGGMFEMYRKNTREVFDDYDNADPEKIKNAEWICDISKLKKLLGKQKTERAFYCGVASNMEELIPLFDIFILLKASSGTVHKRLSSREGTGDIGTTEESRQTVLGWKEWWEEEMLGKGAIAVNADVAPASVVREIIKLAKH